MKLRDWPLSISNSGRSGTLMWDGPRTAVTTPTVIALQPHGCRGGIRVRVSRYCQYWLSYIPFSALYSASLLIEVSYSIWPSVAVSL